MIRLSIRRPVAVSMTYLSIALLGVAAWRNIPIELLPDTQLPQLSVTATWRGASPETMEAFVTAPLEAAIQQVRGVENIESVSEERRGAAQATITIEFARDTEMDFARMDLSERLRALDDVLPDGVDGPTVQPYVPEEFREQQRPFLRYTLTGPHTLEALRAHAEDVLLPELLQVDGVAGVEVSGGRARVIDIRLDETRVQALRLDAQDVWRRINELEYVVEAGAVETDGLLRTVAIRDKTASVAEIREARLIADGRRVVRVSDVATVHDTYEEARSHYRIDGQPAVTLQVHKEVGVNTVAVADRVKARVASLANLHPVGVRLILDDDESEAIKKQLTDLRFRALVAAGVIFLVLLVFLRSFRSAGIVFATIAFSILIALNVIYFSGLTLNVLTLMGLAMGFGLIVDNAIVVLENIYRQLQRGREAERQRAADQAAEEGAKQVVLPILAATLTTVIVFIPFVYLQGELRVFYVPLAIVVGIALTASLFVAFSFIPALAAKALRSGAGFRVSGAGSDAPDTRHPTPLYVRFYSAALGFTLRHPWVTIALAAGTLYGSWHLFDKYVTRGVLWRSWWGQETYIQIIVRLPRGEDLARTDELTSYFEGKLRALPEVEKFVTRVQPQYATIQVTFPDSLEHTWIPPGIKEQMYAYSLLFGGSDVRVYGFGPSFYGGGGGAPNYSIKILGFNYETVRVIAEDLGRRLERFSRIRDVDVNSAGGWYTRDKATEFALDLDRARLALHGLSARDAVYQVQAAVAGASRLGRIRVAGEEVLVDVKLEANEDLDVLELENLLIQTGDGNAVRLSDVATVGEREVLSRIVRENQQYQRYVSYEFRGPTKLGDRVRDAVIASTELPEGYGIEGRQTWEWDRGEERAIWGVLAFSLVLILMVTASLFESLRQPLVVLLTVPMALVGVFLMFFYTNASFTREAYIGVIMMGGIVVNNAILLVDHINHLRRNEGVMFRDAIVQGTLDRVRPILMTSCTTIFGLLPLVLFSEYADANIWNALGYALIGGLATSTFFVLTVTPAVYLVFERRPERKRLLAAGGMKPPGQRTSWNERGKRALGVVTWPVRVLGRWRESRRHSDAGSAE